MKKIISLILVLVVAVTLTACDKEKSNKNALAFKEEYESLNGEKNKKGTEYRKIDIDDDNPYVKVSAEKIVEMINNNETFYLYVGDSMCPWCRSVLEKSIEVAHDNNIEKIYYIEIWDDEGNEILRDKYELVDGKLNKILDGTKAYKELLKKFDNVLSDYTLKDEDENEIEVGEKRIFAPNYFYVENGKVKKMIEGISESQKDPYEELTDEILDDEEEQFEDFFKSDSTCKVGGC